VAVPPSLLATWGSNIRHWPTGFKNGGNRRGPKNALVKTGEGVEDLPKVKGRWVEAVVEKESEPQAEESSLRVYFTAGAYCQISNPREAGRAARRRRTHSEVYDEMLAKGIEMLGQYQKNNFPVLSRCFKCFHEWSIS
jgi:hypothetical protein